MGKRLRIGIFIPVKLVNNPLAAWSLINFNFFLLHTENFDKIIILPILVLTAFEFLLSVFFLTSNNKIALLYVYFKL